MNKFATNILAALVSLAAGAASAADVTTSEPSDIGAKPMVASVWVTSGFWSHHLKNRDIYNQKNTGFGFEVAFNENWSLAVGRYRNSVREQSTYAQAVWTPDATQVRLGDVRLAAGVAFGVVNGYPDMHDGKVSPALLPIASLEYGRVGINLTYIPTIAGKVDGALAVQLKVKAIEF